MLAAAGDDEAPPGDGGAVWLRNRPVERCRGHGGTNASGLRKVLQRMFNVANYCGPVRSGVQSAIAIDDGIPANVLPEPVTDCSDVQGKIRCGVAVCYPDVTGVNLCIGV